jgi:tagatose 1,6-diphosphate aldolase GatY/KbaY
MISASIVLRQRKVVDVLPLVSPLILLTDAQQNRYAVGAFNIENMEMAQAVTDAAERLQTPVIIQTTPSTLKYAGADLFAAMVSALAAKMKTPVALHLDHGSSFALAAQAMKAGYTGVMIDGSPLPYEENIILTAEVVKAARAAGIPVEAELGCVGGKEEADMDEHASQYTDPSQAAEFVARTGVDSLAVAIGTAHGVYRETPRLDIARLSAIRGLVDIPLVLHGASGISGSVLRQCIREGIRKINFATELRIAYSDGVKDYLRAHPDAFDPKTYGKAGYERVRDWVARTMESLAV